MAKTKTSTTLGLLRIFTLGNPHQLKIQGEKITASPMRGMVGKSKEMHRQNPGDENP
jgi:hypothetical protein